MKAKETKSFVSSRLVLSLGILIIATGSIFYQSRAHPVRQPALATCQNQALWPTTYLENQKSCPIPQDSETFTIYWNQENQGSNTELIASFIAKINTPLVEKAEFARIQVDSALVSVDKYTHQVIDKKFSNFSKYNIARFKYDTEITYEVPMLATPLNPNHYYRLEVYSMRVYFLKREFNFKVEYYGSKKILVNALFSTSPFTPLSRVRQFQLPVFILLILISAYFLYRLLGSDLHRLCNPITWLVLLSTASAALYVYPGEVPLISPMYIFVLFQFVFSSTLDSMIFGNALGKPFNTMLPFISIFINIVGVGFTILGLRDTHKEPFPVTREARLDLAVDFQINMKILVDYKYGFHIGALVIGLFRVHAMPKTFAYMMPTFLGVCTWVRAMTKTHRQYLEDNRNPAELCLSFAFLPLLLLILQYTVVDSPRPYLSLPPADDPDQFFTYQFQRLTRFVWQKIEPRDTAIDSAVN